MRLQFALNRYLLLIGIFTLLSSCQTLGPPAPNPTLHLNTQDFAPFSYESNGEVAGPTVDLLRRVCQEAKLNCSFQLMDWKSAQEQVKQNLADGLFVVGWNAPRTEWLYFSDPMLQTEYGFFVRADNTLAFKEIADIKGCTIAVYGPSNTSESLERIKTQLQDDLVIDPLPDSTAVFLELAENPNIQAAYSNRDVGKAYIERLGLRNIRYAGGHKKLLYYTGLSKHMDKAVVEQFNTAFRKLQRAGTLRDILNRHGLEAAPAVCCSVTLRATPLMLTEQEIGLMRRELAGRLYSESELSNLSCAYARRFQPYGGGVVIDNAANLLWQNAPITRTMNWLEAMAYIDQLNQEQFGGFSDWRLPTIEELDALIKYGKCDENDFLRQVVKGNAMPFWSSDEVRLSNNAWTADFLKDVLAPVNKEEALSVIAVRSKR